ncbi:MAG TPA: ATP-binding protein [Thermoanaerobaculia bacterium]|nr:ATP-binding protein [Thermoanaerobaculia bacterium]
MGSAGSPPLTKLSFRRDVRLFLAFLVGLLIFMIAALLITFGRTVEFAAERTVAQWNTAADAAADAIRPLPLAATPSDVIEGRLIAIRARFEIPATTIRLQSRQIRSGRTDNLTAVSRPVEGGELICWFDPSPVANARRTFVMMAIICVIATVAGTVLLLLYLPRITRPVELMLDEAGHVSEREAGQEDTHYVVETFRKSVAVLKAQEEELRRLHALQKTRADDLERVTSALTRSIVSGFLAIDQKGDILDVNAAAREIVALPPNVQGLSIENALGTNQFSAMIREAFERQEALTRAEAEVAVDGTKRVIGLTTVPLMNEDGAFLGMLALFTDLSPFREMETRIREMKNFADLGEIAAGIAHEFRNSLSTILGYLRLSKRAGVESPTAVEKAEREAVSLSNAVDGLLSFARPMDLHPRPVELLDLCETVAERVRMNTAVTIECSGDAAVIEGDAALLERAVENVIRNAAQSVQRKGEGGSVRIEVSSDPPAIVVADDGVGVDPADVPTLFLPFRSENPQGHGLGLPLAKKILLLHGGNIGLTGEPGRGATATITFSGEAVRKASQRRVG